MKNTFLTFLFSLLLTSLLGQTTLQYSLNEGDVFTIKQRAQQIITQELDGATHEITNNIDGILQFKVVGKRDSVYEIALSFTDLNMKMISSIQGELMNVKAKEVAEGDMQSQIFNSLLNSPVQLILAKNGDILEVTGGDSLVSKMANASGLEDEFSIYIYPNKALGVGDTWKNEYSGKLSAKNRWTLNSVNDSVANISGEAEVTMDVKEPATTMKLTGTQTTAIIADLGSGFIQKMTVDGLSRGISTMSQMSDQEIPTTIKSTITYELINQ